MDHTIYILVYDTRDMLCRIPHDRLDDWQNGDDDADELPDYATEWDPLQKFKLV